MPTGCTIDFIFQQDTPNEGREKINNNFACITTGNATGFSYSFFSNANPTTETVGGIPAGSTFPSEKTFQQMMDLLLYPFQTPTFTSFSINSVSNPMEVGNSVAASKTFIWGTSNSANVSANTITVQNSMTGTYVVINSANDGSQAASLDVVATLSAPGTYTWTITGYDTQGDAFSADYDHEFMYRKFYGTSNNTSLTEAQIEALANNPLSNDTAGTYAFASGGYKYICIPISFDEITSVADSATGFNVPLADASDGYTVAAGSFYMKPVTVTNSFGIASSYRVYRTKNILGSSINLIIT